MNPRVLNTLHAVVDGRVSDAQRVVAQKMNEVARAEAALHESVANLKAKEKQVETEMVHAFNEICGLGTGDSTAIMGLAAQRAYGNDLLNQARSLIAKAELNLVEHQEALEASREALRQASRRANKVKALGEELDRQSLRRMNAIEEDTINEVSASQVSRQGGVNVALRP